VHCPQCGSDNPPEYRFCGMCGTPLAKKETPVLETVTVRHEPAVPAKPIEPERTREERVSAPVSSLSGPSFLGLGTEAVRGNGRSDSDVSYLFDEEESRPRRTYWRFSILLLILVAVGALVYLQYRKEGKSWVAPWSNSPPQTPVQASQADQSQPAQPNTPPASQAANTPAPGNAAGSGNTASPDATPPNAAATPEKNPADQAAAPAHNQANQSAEAPSKPEQTETAKAEPPAANTDNADTAEPTQPAKRVRATKPKAARPAAPAASPDDTLVANAEKYLYGRGVPQNCERALSSLRPAAERSNVRARTLLGTMYATGHCVPKDLPNAYRWFAQASRTSPDNIWVQRNLEMIWREMTPQERQLATRSE
jgi:hypothetical protein